MSATTLNLFVTLEMTGAPSREVKAGEWGTDKTAPAHFPETEELGFPGTKRKRGVLEFHAHQLPHIPEIPTWSGRSRYLFPAEYEHALIPEEV